MQEQKFFAEKQKIEQRRSYRSVAGASLGAAIVFAAFCSSGWPSVLIGLIGIFVMYIAVIAATRQMQREIRKLYRNQFEHIVEYSHSPDDKQVRVRANLHTHYLKQSGNPYKTKVYEVIFREGENIIETWDQYQERLYNNINQITTQRHTELRDRNRKDYLTYVAGQE